MSADGDEPRPRLKPSVQVGRLLATGFTAFFLFLALREVATDGLSLSAEAIGIAVVLGLAVLAVVVAWWDPPLGIYALAAVGLAIAILVALAAEADQEVGVVAMSGPYLLSSILIWLGVWRMART